MNPSPEILARLYDSANSISLGGMPQLTRNERILMRTLERKNLFEEKFATTNETLEIFDGSSEEHSLEESNSSHHRNLGSSGSSTRPASAAIVRHRSSNSQVHLATPSSREGRLTPDRGYGAAQPKRRKGVPRDTHFFETEAKFKKIVVPIRIPLTVFDEDVGDVSGTSGIELMAVLDRRARAEVFVF